MCLSFLPSLCYPKSLGARVCLWECQVFFWIVDFIALSVWLFFILIVFRDGTCNPSEEQTCEAKYILGVVTATTPLSAHLLSCFALPVYRRFALTRKKTEEKIVEAIQAWNQI